ncbi:MAG: hypothetical protein Tsb0027_16710 [Wenzhouxiangellaceae bacterium]
MSEAIRSYQAAKLCCSGYSDIQYHEWNGEPFRFDLDNSSPTFNFSLGKSYFKAFHVPENAKGELIRVKSLFAGSATIWGSIMAPTAISFLDQSYNIIETRSLPPAFHHMGVFSDSHGGGVTFTKIPTDIDYMIVHTDPGMFGKTFDFNKTGAANIVAGIYIAESTYQFSVPFSPRGRIFIRIEEKDE